ncbi:MAG: hypothetical protein GX120_10845 [Methanosarcina mazei]|nr:hypothetical protein [Methanosarcina mazei]
MRETYYKIPLYTYSYPIELFGIIFYYIVKEMWKYEFIIFIAFILLSFSLNIYDSIFGFIIYSFIAFFMIAWHEFGHAIMAIHENYGIVNLYMKFDKKGPFIYPSVTHYKSIKEISSSAKVVLGGVVVTLIFNPVINIALYLILQRFLTAELLPGFGLLCGIPFIILCEYFSSNESADLYKLKKLYSSDSSSKKKLSLVKDILCTMKVVIYYSLGKYRYFSEESLSKLVPVKTFNSGIWLGNQLIVTLLKNECSRLSSNPTLNGIPIEKENINIWFSINNKRSVKYIVDKFGPNSLGMLANFREKYLINLFYDNDQNS